MEETTLKEDSQFNSLEGLYFHVLEDHEVETSLWSKPKPLMFGIVSNYLPIGKRPIFIYLSLILDNGNYKFNFGCRNSSLEELINKNSIITAQHHHSDILELIPWQKGDVKGSIGLRGTTIVSAMDDDYEEHLALRIYLTPLYKPNLMLEFTNVNKARSQTVELIKISKPKYPFKSHVLPLKL